MTFARFCLTTTLGVCVAVTSTHMVQGQILGTETESAGAEVQQAGGPTEDLSEISQTSWPSIPLPKLTMPQITMPRLWPSEEDDRPALLAPFVAGASKVSEGSKKAWEGVKDIFSVASKKDASTSPKTTSAERPSIWKRLISRTPQKEVKDGPQTIGEFMSQKRLNP